MLLETPLSISCLAMSHVQAVFQGQTLSLCMQASQSDRSSYATDLLDVSSVFPDLQSLCMLLVRCKSFSKLCLLLCNQTAAASPVMLPERSADMHQAGLAYLQRRS